MADDSTQNSRNPANSGNLAGALAEIMGKFLAGVDDMLPAVVVEYDRTENRATVRPLIRVLKTDGTVVDRAQIASVPVLNLGGGGVVLSFNISPGDLGWVKASDRDISLFLQNETAEDVPPNTLRKHNFGDSLFIPDQFRNWTLDEVDAEHTVLQTVDGLKRISIGSDGIQIISNNSLFIDTPSTVISGNVFHIGSLTTIGDLTVTGTIEAGVDVLAPGATGKSLKSHLHSGVTTGVGNTGPPV